ncbi:uncharacterized protein [Panulirus ornatus]|uniref:uncharacterized protein n=1 Tax=Panulirus ornatus TaxID=150431 RepID=UPI003A89A7DE
MCVHTTQYTSQGYSPHFWSTSEVVMNFIVGYNIVISQDCIIESKEMAHSICNKTLLKNSLVKRDMLTDKDENSSKCSDYQKSFIQHCNLDRSSKVYTGSQQFECSQCRYSFTSRSDLLRHTVIHTIEKPYECSKCQKNFSQKCNLVKHMTTHTGEKPYECSQCQKAFSQRSDLLRHTTVHTGEKPYKCLHCQRTFSLRSYLAKHMTVHTGEKPYECSHCQKTFSRKAYLVQHIKLHKEEELFTAVHPGQSCFNKASQKHHTSCPHRCQCHQTSKDHFMFHSVIKKSSGPDGLKQESGNSAESIISTLDLQPGPTRIVPELSMKVEMEDIDIVKEEF